MEEGEEQNEEEMLTEMGWQEVEERKLEQEEEGEVEKKEKA